MGMAGLAGEFDKDFQMSPAEGFGVVEAVGGLIELGEIVQVAGDIRVVGAEGGFVDFEGAEQEGFGVGEAVGGFIELGEIVQADGDVGVIGTEGFFKNLQRTG